MDITVDLPAADFKRLWRGTERAHPGGLPHELERSEAPTPPASPRHARYRETMSMYPVHVRPRVSNSMHAHRQVFAR